MENTNTEVAKLSPAEYREKFRVSIGTLPNGCKIEVLSAKATRENWSTLPSGREVRNYLCDLYGRKINFITERYSSDGELLVFEYEGS